MAVTCSFKRNYGKLTVLSLDNTPVKCDIWADGNCLMVVTYGREKNLALFFSDLNHLKNCLKDKSIYKGVLSIKLANDISHAGDIAKEFVKAKIPTTVYTPKRKENNHD